MSTLAQLKIARVYRSGGFSILRSGVRGAARATLIDARPGAHGRVLANGSHTFKRAGQATLRLKLTVEGKRIFARAKRLAVKLRLSFTVRHGVAVQRTMSIIELKR